MRASLLYPVMSCRSRRHATAVHEAAPPSPPGPRLLDRVRAALRLRHYSRRTEKAYVAWIRRYIVFHGKRHPAEIGAPELTRFLTSLAIDGRVAASTQNQALSALLFLYREVLELDVPWLDGVVRAKRPVSRRTSHATSIVSVSCTSATSRPAPAGWRHESVLQRIVKSAVHRARIAKRATPHTS
jgi:integrase-like protein